MIATSTPPGDFRINGRQISSHGNAAPLSGAISISGEGKLRVLRVDDADAGSAPSSLQAGPFLVDPGGKPGIVSDAGTAAERTVVATHGERICVLTTTPATLSDLSDFLLARPDAVGLEAIDRALNLDGGPSTGMVVSLPGRNFESEPRGKIRNALLLRLRDSRH